MALLPSNKWHLLRPAKAPSQASSAIFTVCPDKASWPCYPRNLRPISHQLYWEVVRGKHPDFCGIPVSVKVERGSPVGSTDFLLHLPQPPLLPPPTGSCSPPAFSPVGQEEEVAGDAHEWGGPLTGRNLPAEARGSGGSGRAGQEAGAPLRALLMTCGETAQQSLRSSDGGSRQQMFPTYVRN